jgi:hypothetical protein
MPTGTNAIRTRWEVSIEMDSVKECGGSIKSSNVVKSASSKSCDYARAQAVAYI